MASEIGRSLKIKREGDVVAGVRTKSLTFGSEPINVTTDDDDGKRKLLEASGEEQIDLSVEGLTKDENLIAIPAGGGTRIETYTIELPWGGEVTGDFRLNSVEIGAEYQEAITFTAEIHSTGDWTYTPPETT